MELVNLVIIIIMTTICLVWAMRKRREIETTTIDFSNQDNSFRTGADGEQNISRDLQDLTFTSNLFQSTIHAMLTKINSLCLIIFAVMSVIVWVRFLLLLCDLLAVFNI